MAVFRDTTGRPGPSTWEGGTFPTGKDDFPVSGVSWFEAAAYAQFAGKSLPTIGHWALAVDFHVAPLLIPASNFSGKGLARVGSYASIGPFGTYDMAGNAQEWTWNETDDGFRFILGGSWSSPTYQFVDPDAKPPFDRGAANGFRCALYPTPLHESLLAPVARVPRLFDREACGRRGLPDHPQRVCIHRARVEGDHGRGRQQFSLLEEGKGQLFGGLRGERMRAFVFLPKNAEPPYQTLVYHPSAGAQSGHIRQHGGVQPHGIHHSQRPCGDYPIYLGTFDRTPPAAGVDDRGEGAPWSRGSRTFGSRSSTW